MPIKDTADHQVVHHEAGLERRISSIDQLGYFLDRSYVQLQANTTISAGMQGLMEVLWRLRQSSTREEWEFIKGIGSKHPIRQVLHQDPFTWWAYSKPRGYPGDAGLMDLACAEGEWIKPLLANSTPLGRTIYDWFVQFSGAMAVRSRRDYLTSLIDHTAMTTSRPHILSIAAGHLREAGRTQAVRTGLIGRFVALDQDGASLKVVEEEYGPFGVEAVAGSVKDLLLGAIRLEGFDLVYSAGLFDYLKRSTARKLLRLMFNMLNPGGRIVISNALTTCRDAGYMEMFMDWHLIYRSLDELQALSASLPSHLISEQRQWGQESKHFGFVEIVKV